MVSQAMPATQDSPTVTRAVAARHHDIETWGTPHVIRLRAAYEDGLLNSACPRPGGRRLQFRGVMTWFESCVSMVPAVDLLVLDKPIHLGHAAVSAQNRPAGMLHVAIKLDDPRIGSNMLVPVFLNINAVPPKHIIFLCDDAQLRGLVARVPTDGWGLRAIDHDAMASFRPLLFKRAMQMVADLRVCHEVSRHTTHSFALDWDHRGLGPGE